MAVDFIIHDGEESYACRVLHYKAPCAMRVTGSGFGDADPPEEEEFEFALLRNGVAVADEEVYARVHQKALDEYRKFMNHR